MFEHHFISLYTSEHHHITSSRKNWVQTNKTSLCLVFNSWIILCSLRIILPHLSKVIYILDTFVTLNNCFTGYLLIPNVNELNKPNNYWMTKISWTKILHHFLSLHTCKKTFVNARKSDLMDIFFSAFYGLSRNINEKIKGWYKITYFQCFNF